MHLLTLTLTLLLLSTALAQDLKIPRGPMSDPRVTEPTCIPTGPKNADKLFAAYVSALIRLKGGIGQTTLSDISERLNAAMPEPGKGTDLKGNVYDHTKTVIRYIDPKTLKDTRIGLGTVMGLFIVAFGVLALITGKKRMELKSNGGYVGTVCKALKEEGESEEVLERVKELWERNVKRKAEEERKKKEKIEREMEEWQRDKTGDSGVSERGYGRGGEGDLEKGMAVRVEEVRV